MSIISAIILGAIQGIAEFFPISSSGHLIVFGKILGVKSEGDLIFELLIHFATALALLFVIRKEFFKNISKPRKFIKNSIWYIVATVPALIFGIILTIVGTEKLFSNTNLIAINFLIVGLIFLFIRERENATSEPKKRNILIAGVFQIVGLLPGVSRSGITTVGGMISGSSAKSSLKTSFNLFFPIVFAASGKIILDLLTTKNIGIYPVEFFAGFLSAFIFGVLSASTLIKVFEKVGLKPFGIYLIFAGVLTMII